MGRAPDRRQRRRQATIEEIKAAARQQITENGAANLSLGAIARAMGLTPPALYRYFENRDALVVALTIEAYDSLGAAMENSVAALPQEDHQRRFLALLAAYRQWAVESPEDYALMYGAASADIQLSGEQAQQFQRAMMRSLRAMVQVLCAAHDAGRLRIPQPYHQPPPSVRQALAWLQSALQGEAVSAEILVLALTTWIRAHGLVWQELHGYLPRALFGSGELYDMESRVLADSLGLAGA